MATLGPMAVPVAYVVIVEQLSSADLVELSTELPARHIATTPHQGDRQRSAIAVRPCEAQVVLEIRVLVCRRHEYRLSKLRPSGEE